MQFGDSFIVITAYCQVNYILCFKYTIKWRYRTHVRCTCTCLTYVEMNTYGKDMHIHFYYLHFLLCFLLLRLKVYIRIILYIFLIFWVICNYNFIYPKYFSKPVLYFAVILLLCESFNGNGAVGVSNLIGIWRLLGVTFIYYSQLVLVWFRPVHIVRFMETGLPSLICVITNTHTYTHTHTTYKTYTTIMKWHTQQAHSHIQIMFRF